MINVWLDRRVLAYAHQGGAKEAPSSTLFAIERAIGLGIDGIELDVHATADGALVIGHDATIDRTTDGSGAISSLRLEELARFDNAFWFVPGEDAVDGRPATDYPFRGRAPKDRRFALATLAEVFAATPGAILNFDIKQTAPAAQAYEELFAREIMGAGRSDDLIVTSFFDAAIESFRTFAPGVATAPGLNEVTAFVQAVRSGTTPDGRISRHVALQLPSRFGGEPLVDARLIEVAHDLGLAVHAWTVDDPEEMERLLEAQVDGIMSDRPSLLIEVLDRAKARRQIR